jgi:hypothetical protein
LTLHFFAKHKLLNSQLANSLCMDEYKLKTLHKNSKSIKSTDNLSILKMLMLFYN